MRSIVPVPPVLLATLLSLLLACGPGEVMMEPGSQLEHASAAILLAAGDIAGCSEQYNDEATSAMLTSLAGTVAALGDVVQKNGERWEYRQCYHPSWGQVLSRTRPSPGNHDYRTAQAAAYYEYFGSRAGPSGKGWYTYRLGAWRIYSLNSERNIARQAAWLQKQLTATPSKCVLAYWHKPLYTSGRNPGEASVRPLFDVLYQARAEVVLSGHNHNYERFAPQDADGHARAAGIRQFVVGTGGAPLEPFVTVQANSQVRQAERLGVLRLRLYQDSYTWEFLPVGGGEPLDSGSGTCR